MDTTKARFVRAASEITRTKPTKSIPEATPIPIVRGTDGFVVDIRGCSASTSTDKRRQRLGLKNNTKTYNPKTWERGSPLPQEPLPCRHNKLFHSDGTNDHQGHYGFRKSKSNSQLSPPKTKKGSFMTSTKKENKHIYPGTGVNIVPILMTPEGAQAYIDRVNTKPRYILRDGDDKLYEDPHYCCKDAPCSMESKRTKPDGSPDYESGLHIFAIDYDKIISSGRRPLKNDGIIGPSWHSEDIKRWYNDWKSTNKRNNVPFPMHGHDLELIRDSNVSGYFTQFKEKYENEIRLGKKIYLLVNLFGKDVLKPGQTPNEYHIESLQLHRGKVDDSDIIQAGITSGKRHASPETLVRCAKICACRETFEETDKIIKIETNDENLKLIADLQQNNTRVVRTMVFCYENPLGIEKITNYQE